MKQLDFKNISPTKLHCFACHCLEQFVPTSLLKELGQRAIVTKKRWIEGKATNQELDELSDKVTNLLTDIDETICSRLILETILALLEKEPLTCAS